MDAASAVPGPLFVSVTVHDNVSPASFVCVCGVFVMARLGHWTSTESFPVTMALFDPLADAVFTYFLQLALVVGLVTCTLALALAARSPKLHESVLVAIEQPVTAGLMLHEIPVPVGRVSESVTDFAVPGPALLTWTVNPIALPASTVSLSAVFVTERLGQFTTTCAVDCAEPSFAVVTWAVFGIVAQLADVVGETMCTDADAPGASEPKLHVSTPLAIEQAEFVGLIVQFNPDVVGRVSLIVTLVAVPVAAALLVAVMVKPMLSPALTGDASAVFTTPMEAQFTVTDATAGGGTVPPVPVEKLTVAVFWYVPQLAAVVALVMWIVSVAPAASVPVPVDGQSRVPELMTHDGEPDWLAIDQLMPGPAGSRSLSTKLVASPEPLFAAVIVNPI